MAGGRMLDCGCKSQTDLAGNPCFKVHLSMLHFTGTVVKKQNQNLK